ncbi:MAG: YigZ family protein [Acidaminococcales bacterium]|nr:YigZ family protein [Acidaminococcales bacterium]
MTPSPFFTIQKDIQTQFVIEKSRFICTLRKVADEGDALAAMSLLKKRYWDAAHNCSAYIVGGAAPCQKAGDDGEPAGTAGLPMLKVLEKNNLQNVLAVVTRYFGGIKLGAGGLARAYARSVAEAVAAAGTARRQLMFDCAFSESPHKIGKAANFLYGSDLFSVLSVEYGQDALVSIRLPADNFRQAEDFLSGLFSRRLSLTVGGEHYSEIPLAKEGGNRL